MSTLQLVPASSCDDLLDYIYGGLPAARLKSFEDHLPTCDKCKAEVDATQKIRNLTREALPPVEPANDRMAAISAQLLHTAAQRKVPRGPMYRRIMQHPGFAAMAAMLVVGLFITTQWNNLKMPAKQPESAPAAPAATATPAPAPTAATGTTPTTPAPIVAEQPLQPAAAPPAAKPELKSPDPSNDARGMKLGDKSASTSDEGGAQRERSKAEAPAKELYAAKKDAPNDAELLSRAEPKKKAKAAELDEASIGDLLKNNGRAAGSSTASSAGPSGVAVGLVKPSPSSPSNGYYNNKGGSVRGDGDVAGGEAAADDRKQQVAPKPTVVTKAPMPTPKAEPSAPAEQKPGSQPKAVARNYDSNAAPPQAAPPTAAPATSYAQNESQAQGNFSNLGKSRDSSSTAENLRRKGEAYARSGKCVEALRMYSDANRISPNADANAADQLTYARCLRESGRLDAAQMALDNLQRQNVQSNSLAVENEQQVLQAQRRSSGAPAAGKASKAAPKRAAPAATEKAADAVNAY